ncbi:hypothetical protein FisN_41Lu018 [Fistulifera solaris]|uniref:Rhodanese domain-containing protein n=1 Tax=Fistulifera solaris TaxID=1519565 RepID=A0A1Z5KPI1_FISSO|nr:hypothetical protein FisN_41Lu018 [Fistulifera solaris]|eukprot:GAX28223.1 hypothetical protein FisN_41Lu018 [Fistulifera solaris]
MSFKRLFARIAFVSLASRPSSGAFVAPSIPRFSNAYRAPLQINHQVRRMAASSTAEIKHVGKEEMRKILNGYEENGREASGCVVIDVRTEEEVYSTGKLSPSVHTLPVQVIMQANVFQMDPDDFEDYCGFAKPTVDETIVFSCAAGVRSVYACQFAAKAGYSNLINYVGGSHEWFGN